MKIKFNYVVLVLFSALLLTNCSTKRRLKRANGYYQAGEYFTAIEAYQKVLKRADRSLYGEVYYKLGECHRMINLPKNAEKWYKRSIRQKYQEPLVYLYTGDMRRMLEKYDEAKESYTEFLELLPEDTRGKTGMAACDSAKIWSNYTSFYKIEEMKKFNSYEVDFCPVIAKKDNRLLYFTSSREASKGNKISGSSGMYFTDIFQSKKDLKGEWSTPTPVEEINTEYDDGVATFNSKYNAMYFTRCIKEKSDSLGCKIYKTSKSGDQWNTPQIVDIFGDSTVSIGHPALSPDELTLYFVTDKDSLEDKKVGQGGKDIWMVKRKMKTYPWEKPENLGPEINTPENEMFPYAKNDSTLYFASNGHLGLGGLDIYKAVKQKNGKWRVENMKPPINSFSDDFGITFENGENVAGFFSSTRKANRGEDNIYRFEIPPIVYTLSGVVKDEQNDSILPGVDIAMIGSNGTQAEQVTDENGSFTFDLRPETDYLVIAKKKNYFKGKGMTTTKGLEQSTNLTMEIYMIPYIVADADEPKEDLLTDIDKLLQKLVNEGDNDNENRGNTGDDNNGSNNGDNENNNDNNSDGNNEDNDNQFDEDDLNELKELYGGLNESYYDGLQKSALAAKRMNIFYDLNKWNLRKEGKVVLDAFSERLTDNPDIKIELSSHTDFRDSEKYNLLLSQKRAQSAVDYLIQKGVDPGQISARGYGEWRPSYVTKKLTKQYNFFKEGDILTEKYIKETLTTKEQREIAHQLNRRTEFRVLGDTYKTKKRTNERR